MVRFRLSKFVKEDLRAILKHFWGRLLGVSILIGFLIFLLNIFLGVGFYANQFSHDLKDKLGMYFYIKEVPGEEDEIYKEILLMKDEMQAQWLQVSYSTKNDALAFLQKKIPDVVENFEKFGIENPLPATLYVMFSNEQQYDVLKTVILAHKDIILNPKDVDSGTSIKEQENRILQAINFGNVIVTIAYSIIILLLIIVLVFLAFLLQTIFSSLHKEFEVKKLLGASHLDVTKSFILVTLDVIILAFVVALILLLLSWFALNAYLTSLFNLSFIDILANVSVLVFAFIIELVVIGGISMFLAYVFTNALHKKLRISRND